MRTRSIRVRAIAALALVTALGCVVASAPLHAKQYPLPKRPQQVAPPPVHLIKCAAALDGWQCWPDPGMMRLERPRMRFDPPPLDRPRSGPSR